MDEAEAAGMAVDGRRIFVVEDETVVALMIEDMLEDLGCRLVGSHGSLSDALGAVETTDAEIALLDVNVGGEPVFPAAERLEARGVALIFATGYGSRGLPERWRGRTVLGKPFLVDELRSALTTALAAGRQPGQAPAES